MNGVTTEYVLNGSQVMRQIIDNGTTTYVVDYIYHENGIPLAFAYYQENGTPVYYFYETNLQGDVVAIYDANGAKVVGFRYDAWGCFNTDKTNTTICTDTFLRASLFRYRSYIYDYETGLYYLQSRYYDPETGRFLNADGYINANGDLIGFNMYAYCSNNPVNYVDQSGNVIEWVVLAVLGVLAIAGLSSCGNNTPAESDDERLEEYEEWIGGTKNKQEKIDEAIAKTHSTALENNHDYEYGTFVYKDAYDYYHMINVYSTREVEKIDMLYNYIPKNSIAIAFIHTHNKHNETLIFNSIELPDPYENYVVDIGGCVYYAAPNASYVEVEQIKKGICRGE